MGKALNTLFMNRTFFTSSDSRLLTSLSLLCCMRLEHEMKFLILQQFGHVQMNWVYSLMSDILTIEDKYVDSNFIQTHSEGHVFMYKRILHFE